MLAANASSSSKSSSQIICTMKPLLDCLQRHLVKRELEQPQEDERREEEKLQQQQPRLVPEGDISQCQKEVLLFEKTCSKSVAYVHDREGLEDTRSGLYSGKRAL